MKKILFMLTSHDELGSSGRKTGFWFDEVISPYYRFIDAGYEVVMASPKGGPSPIDPDSELLEDATQDTKRYFKDDKCKTAILETLKLTDIKSCDYEALYYPGGYGPLFDLLHDPISLQLISDFYAEKKIISAVCHGTGVFKDVRLPNGDFFIKGKKLTGFADSEEAAINMTDLTPFLVEKELTHQGAIYSKAGDWQEHVVIDNKLITEQNPASANLVANAVIRMLAI
ncbi:type 1 glutamine amidotransferase domain-containing protein [Pedobacter psychrotolerans]|uniref:type 1 glutamine amidotransferase domain-containing protein n=1 Tax=Pedobacter psychrotolerans TaxID=1843235 RepID=UPI003F98F1B8